MRMCIKALCLSFLAVFLSGGVKLALAEDCDSYAKYSEPYFNCMFNKTSASYHNNCAETTDSRFPGVPVIKLMSHGATFNPNDPATIDDPPKSPKFIGLVKDGASLTCPSNQPGDTPYWQAGEPYEGKIVVNYAPCDGKLVTDATFLDNIDCNPTGKATDAVDDLDSNSNRKTPQTVALASGDCQKAYGVNFCAEVHLPYICAYVPNGLEKIYIGCYPITPTSASVPPPSLACFIPSLCWDKNAISGVSKNPIHFSISGAVAMCAEGAIDKIFFSGWDSSVAAKMNSYGTFSQTGEMGAESESAYACPAVSMFYRVQQSLRAAALGAITLWVVLWGIKITISGAAPSRGEFIKKLMVVSIVMYFSLGAGWTEYLPIIKQLMVGLSTAMMQAVTGNDPTILCVHNASEYPPGFETMALWDTFDCKIITYFFSDQTFPKMMEVAILSIFTAGIYGVLILLLSLVFAFFLIGLLIYSIEIYIVSLIVIALLVFISPIFIPMALFSATNGYFKAWLGELISVSLYPVILFGFIALMLAVFDRFYFGDCQSASISCTTYPFGTYAVQADPNSAGAQLHVAQPNWDDMTINGFNFELFLLNMLKICFFAYLFFRFMGILGPFVSELVGSAKTDLSTLSTGTGQKVMGAGANAAKKTGQIAVGAIKGAATGGKAGAVKGAVEGATKDDKGGGGGTPRVDTTKS